MAAKQYNNTKQQTQKTAKEIDPIASDQELLLQLLPAAVALTLYGSHFPTSLVFVFHRLSH